MPLIVFPDVLGLCEMRRRRARRLLWRSVPISRPRRDHIWPFRGQQQLRITAVVGVRPKHLMLGANAYSGWAAIRTLQRFFWWNGCGAKMPVTLFTTY